MLKSSTRQSPDSVYGGKHTGMLMQEHVEVGESTMKALSTQVNMEEGEDVLGEH